MSKYVRKTRDEYHTQGNYGCGWETVFVDCSLKEARETLIIYADNERQYPHRIVKTRVRKEEQNED